MCKWTSDKMSKWTNEQKINKKIVNGQMAWYTNEQMANEQMG